MFLVLMLKQLAHLAKLLVAWLAVVRKLRSSGIGISLVFQHRSANELLHLSLSRSILVDLIPRIGLSPASSAGTALNMLDSVGTRTESTVSANRARDLFRTVHLHVHVDFILAAELASTCSASEVGSGDTAVPLCLTFIHARSAARLPFTLRPLIVAVVIFELTALTAIPTHLYSFSFLSTTRQDIPAME